MRYDLRPVGIATALVGSSKLNLIGAATGTDQLEDQRMGQGLVDVNEDAVVQSVVP